MLFLLEAYVCVFSFILLSFHFRPLQGLNSELCHLLTSCEFAGMESVL